MPDARTLEVCIFLDERITVLTIRIDYLVCLKGKINSTTFLKRKKKQKKSKRKVKPV